MKAINILWDTEGQKVDLPTEITIPKGMTDAEEISDYISDETGFCHYGFDLDYDGEMILCPNCHEDIIVKNGEARCKACGWFCGEAELGEVMSCSIEHKRIKFLLNKIEELGFSVEQAGESVYCIGNFTPCGQDCSVDINPEDDADRFIRNIKDYAYDFDVSYEAYLWLDNTGHGTNGAPYDMKDVYEDMEWWRNALLKLADTLAIELSEYDRLMS